jgi:hypothetical protein
VADKEGGSAKLESGILEPPLGGEEKIPVADLDTALDGGRGMLTKEQLDKRESDFLMMILETQKKSREAVKRKGGEKRSTRSSLMKKWFK